MSDIFVQHRHKRAAVTGTPRVGNAPTRSQGTAAFAVGCLMAAALFAAAIFGYLPANLMSPVIRLCIAVAGGGFTMFLLGYVSGQLPNGLKIGGPLGVFVLLFLLTPANEIKSFFNNNLAECESNVDDRASVAQPFCEKAVAELPNEPRPLLLLGTAQSNTGRYREAIESWSRALNLGADKGLAHYNIAFAQYQLKDYESAIKSASLAAKESESNKGLKALNWYLIAEAESALWKDGQGDAAHFVNARDKYLAFIDTSSPTYRAEGNLACMLAAKAILTTDDAQKSAMEDQALAHFDNALASIKAYSGPNDSSEKLSFATAFRPDANDCNKKLAELWARKRSDQSYDSVVASVPG